MTIKRIIKETFNEEFDSEKMKNEILSKMESKKTFGIKTFYKIAIPLCIGVFLIVGILTYRATDKIYINELNYTNNISKMSNDIEEELTNKEPIFKLIEGKVLPTDFQEEKYKKVITRSTIGNTVKYVFSTLGKNNRRVEISILEENDLSRKDSYKEDIKKSKINGIEMVIYQYESIYLTNFFYQGHYFDIKTYDISQDEFITLLKSILKGSN